MPQHTRHLVMFCHTLKAGSQLLDVIWLLVVYNPGPPLITLFITLTGLSCIDIIISLRPKVVQSVMTEGGTEEAGLVKRLHIVLWNSQTTFAHKLELDFAEHSLQIYYIWLVRLTTCTRKVTCLNFHGRLVTGNGHIWILYKFIVSSYFKNP